MKLIKAVSFFLLGLLIFNLGSVNNVKAQNTDKLSYSIDAGIGIPANPYSFTQFWNVGYGFGGGLGYEIQPSVKLQVYAQYYRFGLDEKGVKNNVNTPQAIRGIEGATAETFHVMLNVIYEYRLPEASTTPYFSLGSGFFKAGRDEITVTTTANNSFSINEDSGTTVGVNGAVGIRQAVSKNLSFNLEAKFVTGLFVERNTQYVPISLGINF